MRWLAHVPIVLLFGAAFSSVARADGPTRQELARAGKGASAFVLVKKGSGSAFCIHPSGLFITNHHVIDGGGEIKLVLNANRKDQRAIQAKVLRSDREADLALLQAEGVKDLPLLQIGSDDKLSEGDEVVACGFPFGKALSLARDEYPAITVTFGKVTALRQKSGDLNRIQLDVELHPGNSGGPILGSDGKVVGVAVSGIKGTNFRFAIPARKVWRFIEAPSITFRPPSPGPGEWHKPLDFEVQAVSFLPSTKPFETELILSTPGAKERKFPMKRTGDTHGVKAPLLVASGTPQMVRCTVVVSRDGKEWTRIGSWIVNDSEFPKLYLADLPQADFKKGPWDLGIGTIGRHFKTPIRVGGQESPRGLSTQPNSSISYRLKKGGLLFRSKIGIDDSGRPTRAAPINFEVLGDGKVLWTSRLFARGETDECSVDVSEVDTLELRVSVDGNNFDANAVWLEPNVLADGKRLRSEPAVAIDEKDRTIKKMPAPIDDVALGGGGRYLILSLPRERKLAVLDVTNLKAEKFIALDEAGPFRIAAGADKLLVLYTEKKVLDRYSLTTLKKETSIDLPFEGNKVCAVAMGSASHGPLLVVGEKPPLVGVPLLLDVQRMRKLWPKWQGDQAGHTGDNAVALASADGQVFAVGAANIFSRGFHTILLEGENAITCPSKDFPFYAWPGGDGRVVFTSNGLYTSRLQDPAKGPHQRGSLCLPASQGDLYLRAGIDSFSLYLLGNPDPLLKVTGTGWPVNPAKEQVLPPVKRIFLLPGADLIVTIPTGNEEVRFHRFSFSRALEKASGDWLFVAAFSPPPCAKGKRFLHELRTFSKKSGVKYQIVSGPKGMSVSEKGMIEWEVPKDFTEGLTEVRIRLQDNSEGQRIYSLRVRVE